MAITIAQAVKKILRREPFYGLFLLGLNKYFDDTIETACVRRNGINVELVINETYGNSLKESYAISLLLHECLHILLKHFQFWDLFPNKERLNVATDCECNSFLGEVHPDGVHPKKYDLPEAKGTKFYYDNLPDGVENEYFPPDEHNGKDFKDLSEAEKKLIENQIDYQVKSVAEEIRKSCGNIPGQFKDYVNSLFQKKPEVFNGRAYFKRVVGNSIKTYLKSTRYKPSFRFKGQPGTILKFNPKVLVAIDTSGSISNDELKDFFTELEHLYKTGVFIEVVEFDTCIQNKFVYKGQKTDIKIIGRGGTSADEVYKYYTENPSFSTLVIFTDGYLNINYPKQKNMIGIISSNGVEQNYPGISVYIPKEK